MRPAERQSVARICKNLVDRKMDEESAKLLLLGVREYTHPKRQSELRDLANCAAHESREGGMASDYLKDFAKRFRDPNTKPDVEHVPGDEVEGEPETVGILYSLHRVLPQLFTVLQRLDIDHDPIAITNAEYPLATSIAKALDGTVFKLGTGDREDTCTFVADINADSRFVQPAYFFNKLLAGRTSRRVDWHMSGPLFIRYVVW